MLSGIQDIRYALRGFVRSPLFTAVAVLSVALGIGANAAIFSLFDQMLLRPLPVAHPERLVLLDQLGSRIGSTFTDYAFSNTMYRNLAAKNQTFDEVAALYCDSASLSYKSKSETVPVAVVSGNFFNALGLGADIGQVIQKTDDLKKNAHPVAVLGYGYFTRRFGGDASVVGQNVRINSQLHEVIDVAPKGFVGLEMDRVPSL